MRKSLSFLLLLFPVLAAQSAAAGQNSVERSRQIKAQGAFSAQLEVSVEFATPICPGSNINYRIRVTNTSSAVSGPLATTIEDIVPAGTTILPASVTGGAVYNPATNKVVWVGALAPSQVASFGYSVSVDASTPSGAQITNQVTAALIIDAENVLMLTRQVPVSVDCPILVDVDKQRQLALPFCSGGNIAYSVRLTNLSQRANPLSARIEDPIPANATYVQGSASGGAVFEPGSNRIVWDGTLGPGQSKNIGFSIVADGGLPNGTVIQNTVTGILTDPASQETAQDQHVTSDTVNCPPLGMELDKDSMVAEPICPGSNIAYTIRLRNLSQRSNALDARIVDTVPANVSVIEASLSEGAVFDPIANQVTWEGQLQQGEDITIGFSVLVDEGAVNGTVLRNQVAAVLNDPLAQDGLQRQAETQDTVNCPPPGLGIDLRKEQSFAAPLCRSNRITYTLMLSNTSERQNLQEARIVDSIPAGTQYLPDSATGGAEFDPENNQIVWEGELGPGQTAVIGFTVGVFSHIPNGTLIRNLATGRLTDPLLEDFIEDSAQVQALVDCAGEVIAPKPKVRQTVWLWNVSFVDDEDPWASGEMWYASWARHQGGDVCVAKNQDDKEIPVSSGVERGVNQILVQKDLCCPVKPLQLFIDFWDDDDRTGAKIIKIFRELAGIADAFNMLEEAERVGAVLNGSANIAEALELDAPTREELGTFRSLVLDQPIDRNPEHGDCEPCVLTEAADTEDAQSTDSKGNKGAFTMHDIFLNGGAGRDNGKMTLAWQANQIGQCQRVADPAFPLLTSGPIEDLILIGASQSSAAELELEARVGTANLLDPLPEGESRVFRFFFESMEAIEQTRGAALAPTAWRVDVTQTSSQGTPTSESMILQWDGSDWIPTGAEALAVTILGDKLRVVVDHADIGAMIHFSVHGDLSKDGTVIDALPADPSQVHPMQWIEDTVPPAVSSSLLIPLEDGDESEQLSGAFERIEIGFNERVQLMENIRIEPALGFTHVLDGKRMEIVPEQPLKAGDYTLTIPASTSDRAGNLLDGNMDGVPGDPFQLRFSILGRDFIASDPQGGERDVFEFGEEIHAVGENFVPSASFDIYLVHKESVSDGAPLSDRSLDGPTRAETDGQGRLQPTNISPSVVPGEFSLVADLDRDGHYQEGSDRLWRPGGIGVNVPGSAQFFAQFGDGQSLFSQVSVLNLDPASQSQVTLELNDDLGQPISVDLNGDVIDGRQELLISPNGLASLKTDGQGLLQAGSAIVSGNTELSGLILFGGDFGLAGVGSSQPLRELIAPIETRSGVNTGLAMMGLGADVTIDLQLRDSQGTLVASADVPLGAKDHSSRFVDELDWDSPPDFADFSGSIRASARSQFAATVIRQSEGEFATLPVAARTTLARPLFFAQFGDGDSITSQVTLLNLDPDNTASATLHLFDDSGAPLDVTVGGTPVNGKMELVIPADGTVTLVSGGKGPLQTGSAMVTSDRALAGVILFSGPFGVAGVGESRPLRRMAAPMETSPGVNTGVALVGLDEDLAIELELRDEQGNQVSRADVVLAAHAHSSRFVNEFQWDTPPDFTNFRGTLVASGSADFAATVIRVSPGQFATFPVEELK